MKKKPTILIIDDDKGFCYTLENIVRTTGCSTECAYTLKEGLFKAKSGCFDIILLDVMMPDGIGFDIIPDLLAVSSEPEVIILTSRGDPNGAEFAIKSGVWDYIQKPSTLDQILLPIKYALQYRETRQSSEKDSVAQYRGEIIGNSLQIKSCLELLNRAAQSDANVIITGETGTGKELFAKFIHHNSRRKDKKLVTIDCAAIPEALVETILFGHEKGAFTGANRAKSGIIKQADGGTLFLDEIGEMPLSIQKAFLRVIQERRVRAVGATEEYVSDFRVVAATHRNLDEMVKKNSFREDLMYRLMTFSIETPALRQRKGDIKELTLYFTNKFCKKYQVPVKRTSTDFVEVLEKYQWPGNVRELVHALERAVVSAGHESMLFVKHLPSHIRTAVVSSRFEKENDYNIFDSIESECNNHFPTLKVYRENTVIQAENNYLSKLMTIVKGDIMQACKTAGLQQSRLYDLLRKHNILVRKLY